MARKLYSARSKHQKQEKLTKRVVMLCPSEKQIHINLLATKMLQTRQHEISRTRRTTVLSRRPIKRSRRLLAKRKIPFDSLGTDVLSIVCSFLQLAELVALTRTNTRLLSVRPVALGRYPAVRESSRCATDFAFRMLRKGNFRSLQRFEVEDCQEFSKHCNRRFTRLWRGAVPRLLAMPSLEYLPHCIPADKLALVHALPPRITRVAIIFNRDTYQVNCARMFESLAHIICSNLTHLAIEIYDMALCPICKRSPFNDKFNWFVKQLTQLKVLAVFPHLAYCFPKSFPKVGTYQRSDKFSCRPFDQRQFFIEDGSIDW
eukprot:711807_1